MMRGVGGVVAVAVTALMVCCSAYPHPQEQDVSSAGAHSGDDRYDANGHKPRNLDSLGGGHLIRQVRQTPKLVPYRLPNIFKPDLNTFVVKRNYDEMDRTMLPLSKRFFSGPGYRYQNIDMPIEMSWRSGFDKKRLSQGDYPMDEIDVSNFPIGSKRSLNNNYNAIERFYSSGLGPRGRRGGDFPMDEIDASYFPVGSRRSVSR